ncbi:orotidine-5'-phosphate decarboxylase [Spirochaeta cellobiosiphila]|uniref:orotidine-5'-phosphate decarboxylase n=1 Tax=Spirochaeta cellobiosiphila TaxID=504483 RepID=UPI00069F77F8|nr:orotidine-5'-phosphate decarboxylase [Spirochaeta cellobiosiphila]
MLVKTSEAHLYFDKLKEKCERKNSLLCVGLDPRINEGLTGKEAKTAIINANKALIESTAAYTAIYKPNSAFYEAYGAYGFEALEETLTLIPDDIDVLLDSKRGDIGATAEAYAKSVFGHFNVDAVTLAPYMGIDGVTPFLEYGDKGIFMLCYTSNPGSAVFQEVKDAEGVPLYHRVAEESLSWNPNIGLVVAGNKYKALRDVRKISDKAWFLSPGIGAQGGQMDEAIQAGLNSEGYGIIPVVVRAIAHADNPGKAAKEYVEQLNRARERVLG